MARSALLNVMTQAALKAGRSLARDFGEVQNLQVSLKGPGDYVSQADRKAEDIIYNELSRARPGYSFLMEERGAVEGDDDQHRWIVDPLDGTTNFLHGIPIFSISIALERQGELVAGVIFNPVMDELYTAERGNGAFLNDRRMRVAARTKLVDSVVGTGIPHLGRGNHGRALRPTATDTGQTRQRSGPRNRGRPHPPSCWPADRVGTDVRAYARRAHRRDPVRRLGGNP